jgi:hypothetical protein
MLRQLEPTLPAPRLDDDVLRQVTAQPIQPRNHRRGEPQATTSQEPGLPSDVGLSKSAYPRLYGSAENITA